MIKEGLHYLLERCIERKPQVAEELHIEGQRATQVLVPEGYELQVLSADHKFGHPEFVKALVETASVESFIRYIENTLGEGVTIFIDRTVDSGKIAMRMIAFMDFNTPEKPGNLFHVVRLTMEYSDQMDVWIKHHNQWMTQVEFAEFIEDNGTDVVQPDTATMLEIAQTLTGTVRSNFDHSERLQNGDTKLLWTKSTDATARGKDGEIEIPPKFTILCPVYVGQMATQIPIRLRFRINEDGVTFKYLLPRQADLLLPQQKDVIENVQERLKDIATVYEGTYQDKNDGSIPF